MRSNKVFFLLFTALLMSFSAMGQDGSEEITVQVDDATEVSDPVTVPSSDVTVQQDDVIDDSVKIETKVETDTPTPSRRGVEKVEVTGSHIRRTDVEGPSPIVVIDREEIEASGFNSVGAVIKNTSAAPFGGASTEVNLRGVGSSRTLILINGQRAPKSGSSYADGSTNPNFVPLAAVERIEILKDGASATYGSDALGGVVNIITRTNIDGIAFATKYDQSGPIGGDTSRTSIAYAKNSGRSNFLASLQYTYSQGSRLTSQRRYEGRIKSLTLSPNILHDNAIKAGPNCNPSDVNSKGQCTEDLSSQYEWLPGHEIGLVSTWSYDITSDTQFYTTLIGNFDQSGDERYGATFSTPEQGSGISFDGNEAAAADWEGKLSGKGYKAGDPIRIYGRLNQRRQSIDQDTMGGLIVGTKGYWGNSDWTWDANINNQVYFEHNRGINQGLYVPLRAAIASNEFKPFSQGNNEAGLTADSVVDSRYQVNWANASSTGEVGSFIGANWSSAVGVSVAHFEYADDRDDRVLNNQFMGLSGVEGGGERQMYASYAELSGLFGKSFEAQFSVRNDTYSDFGSTTNPRVAVRYQPVKSVTLRGSAGTGFKAPELQDAYGPRLEGFYNGVIDTKACAAAGSKSDPACRPDSFSARLGANRDLQEETSVNYNVGVIVEPFRYFNFSVDYWVVKVDDTISPGEVQKVLDLEARGVDVSKYGAKVVRNGTGGIDRIEMFMANLGKEEADGLDVGLDYTLKTSAGDFIFGSDLSYMFNYYQSFYEELGREQVLGQAGRPRWRNVARLGYKRGKFGFNLFGRTTSRVEKKVRRNGGVSGYIEQFTQFDTSVEYAFSGGSRLQIGALNVFDQSPPFDETDGARVNTSLYRPFHTTYLTYRQDF